MSEFLKLSKKKKRSVIGILSGTSIDAVDVVLVGITGSGTGMKLELIHSDSFPIKRDLKNRILTASYKDTGNVEDICRLNVQLGQFFSKCVNDFIKSLKLTSDKIDLIGSHGQTIQHLPAKESFMHQKRSSTLQIGDPSVIAACTGITTVGDFRMADVGASGSGAPLVPILDYLLFSHKSLNRLLVNIGGISNIAILPAGCALKDVIAFDTGPGNMLIDFLSDNYFGKPYDKDGKIAAEGKINWELLKSIRKMDVYVRLKPPKSAGRETYGKGFAEQILKMSKGMPAEDVISTVTEYTSLSLYESVNDREFDEVIVNGGGASNKFLMNSLREKFGKSLVKKMDHKGIDADNKEAVLFAVLANEAVAGNRYDLARITGSEKPVILGKICQA